MEHPFSKFTQIEGIRPLSDSQWGAFCSYLVKTGCGLVEFEIEKTQKGNFIFDDQYAGCIFRRDGSETFFYWRIAKLYTPNQVWVGGGSLEHCAASMLSELFSKRAHAIAGRHHAFVQFEESA